MAKGPKLAVSTHATGRRICCALCYANTQAGTSTCSLADAARSTRIELVHEAALRHVLITATLLLGITLRVTDLRDVHPLVVVRAVTPISSSASISLEARVTDTAQTKLAVVNRASAIRTVTEVTNITGISTPRVIHIVVVGVVGVSREARITRILIRVAIS